MLASELFECISFRSLLDRFINPILFSAHEIHLFIAYVPSINDLNGAQGETMYYTRHGWLSVKAELHYALVSCYISCKVSPFVHFNKLIDLSPCRTIRPFALFLASNVSFEHSKKLDSGLINQGVNSCRRHSSWISHQKFPIIHFIKLVTVLPSDRHSYAEVERPSKMIEIAINLTQNQAVFSECNSEPPNASSNIGCANFTLSQGCRTSC